MNRRTLCFPLAQSQFTFRRSPLTNDDCLTADSAACKWITSGWTDGLCDFVLKAPLATVSSGAAQDMTHIHQFPANWFQTGSEQRAGLGVTHTDYTYKGAVNVMLYL